MLHSYHIDFDHLSFLGGTVKRVLFGALGAILLSSSGVMASGTVPCNGVVNAGGMDYFTKLGWQAFYGTGGRPSELWLDNHTKVTVHVILRATGGFVDNTLVSPGSTKTMYFPDDEDVTGVECSFWSGQQLPANSYSQNYQNGLNRGGSSPAPAADLDIDIDVDDPDALGGVSVDVDPAGDVTNLDDLRGKILKAL